jgi:hypothetical protein
VYEEVIVTSSRVYVCVPSAVRALSETLAPVAKPGTLSAAVLFPATCPANTSDPPVVTYTFTGWDRLFVTWNVTGGVVEGVGAVFTCTLR